MIKPVWVRTATIASLALTLGLAFNNCSPVSQSMADQQQDFSSVKDKEIITLKTASADSNIKGYVRGRLLVIPKEGVADDEVERLAKSKKSKSRKKIHPKVNVHIIDLEDGVSELEVLEQLKNDPLVESVELDMIVAPGAILNDPGLSSEWHIPKTQTSLAWDSAQGDGIIAAVLDTGVDPDHPDLMASLLPGYNFYDNNTDSSDVYGHGTPVAGTIAAIGNNAIGVAGMAPRAKILPIRISGLDGYASWSAISQGLTWAADKGARVANISYGVCDSSSVISAANYLKSKGGLTTASAGNSSLYENLANAAEIICVSATDSADNKASWSNYGTKIDVAAPGVNIYTTANGGGYRNASGTSFSAPATAGVIALIMSANPSLPPNQVEAILKDNADDLGAAGRDDIYGYGRVNSARAVTAALAAVAQDSIKPTLSFQSPASGAVLKGLVDISVSASDNVAVSRVEIYLNNALLASISVAPYIFNLDSTLHADGSATLMAKAFDGAGNSSSVSLAVKIANTVDSVAPVVTSLLPADGTVIGSKAVSIKSAATDNVGVTKMEILVDGKVVCTSTSGAISCSWNPRKASAGQHTVEARAYDLNGNVGSKQSSLTKK